MWAALSSGELRLQATATVLAPCARAYSIAATVNGVRPLAATPDDDIVAGAVSSSPFA